MDEDGEERSLEYSHTGFAVTLKRVPKSYFMNTYVPSGLLALIAAIGFVIPVDMVPGRMALLVTIFLMLVNISTMVNYRGPEVNTMKLSKTSLVMNFNFRPET